MQDITRKVQGRELRRQENLEWNTDLIEMMELKHVMSQAAQDLDGETRHESPVNETHEHKFIKRRLVNSTARPHEPRRCA